jgi:propanol-preferring alcohol dehydrogenase
MSLMKAVQIAKPGADLVLIDKEVPEPGEREVLIKVEACGVCHGDAVARYGAFPGTAYPRVPGHEVVGTVVKRGSRVTGWRTGARVGVGWSGGWCMTCEACVEGRHHECEDSWITGLSIDGGYAEYMVGGLRQDDVGDRALPGGAADGAAEPGRLIDPSTAMLSRDS